MLFIRLPHQFTAQHATDIVVAMVTFLTSNLCTLMLLTAGRDAAAAPDANTRRHGCIINVGPGATDFSLFCNLCFVLFFCLFLPLLLCQLDCHL